MANNTTNNPFAKLGAAKLDTSLTRSTNQPPAQEKAPENKKHNPLQYQSAEQANARTMERPNGRRIITRNSFEIYEDQMDSLRQFSYEDKMQGKLGSMSAMVREAIDTYIQKRRSSEK
jgi:hypothetical protein